MEITVRYFAAARELCSCNEERIQLNGVSRTVDDLLGDLCERHPPLSPYRGRMRLAINAEFAQATDTVRDGDEVSVMPPVAGGSPQLPEGHAHADIRDKPLSLDEAVLAVSHPGAGGIAVFLGVVRDHAEGKSVSRLDYEAHAQMAATELRRVLVEICQERADTRLAAQHRVGRLAVGDTAVIVAASAPHRADAFVACRLAIDRIKERVPIWKKEWDVDGTPHWVNL
ncbi:MAG: molybdenum cofactor biosynthesis protein MoaE [Myxococcales bacterium]|nr:molybdenum cofactor biosynthesis protein MoaE [Myxococcales bacterium]MDD9971548.1 molybdenum cofactor biosynthesis protein MoaE [Myxococcales bacterium]